MPEQTVEQRRRVTEQVAVLLIWVVIFALVFGLLGCKIITKNQGEAGIRYGTEITFFSRAAQTAPEPATIETQSQPLNTWLERKAEEPPTPEVEPNGP